MQQMVCRLSIFAHKCDRIFFYPDVVIVAVAADGAAVAVIVVFGDILLFLNIFFFSGSFRHELSYEHFTEHMEIRRNATIKV